MNTRPKSKQITVDYVRMKLGERGKKMSEQQIAGVLVVLRFVCNRTIDNVIKHEK